MAKKFKFAGETCVYCARRPATTPDHVFARGFFAEQRRGYLPQVPACEPCNSQKSGLEHYLTAVLPFGARHADAEENLTGMVPGRLAKNLALHRRLADGFTQNAAVEEGVPVSSLPFDPEELGQLFEFIAKGLSWHHWRVLVDDRAGVWAEMLTEKGEALFSSMLALNSPARVDENLGADTFSSVGAQGTDEPPMSMWVFSIHGGLLSAVIRMHRTIYQEKPSNRELSCPRSPQMDRTIPG